MQIVDSNNSSLLQSRYPQVSARFDASYKTLWTFINQQSMVPSFNPDLLDNLYEHHKEIENTRGKIFFDGNQHDIRYSILASLTPGYFNLGGHLVMMSELIQNRDREGLIRYATRSVDVVAQRTFRFRIPSLITISLLQGETLGAGIEAALTSDILIAERQCILGFPEIMFNMFPGMGAYSFISRKAGIKLADEMILGGKLYTAEECYQKGLVDILAEEGQGEQAVYNYIQKQERRANGFLAIQKAKQRVNPVTYEELMDITHVWVDAALNLTERDLKVMDRFVRSQEKLFGQQKNAQHSGNQAEILKIA